MNMLGRVLYRIGYFLAFCRENLWRGWYQTTHTGYKGPREWGK